MDAVVRCDVMESKDLKNEIEQIKKAFKLIASFMKKEGLNIYPYPKIKLNWSEQDGLFIKTGYYLPSEKEIVLFCKDRHPKDILRSFAHEMIHHEQNLNGKDLNFTSNDNVKDNNKLEKLESEAYLKGNIYFRKWTEYEQKNKNSILNENILKESPDTIENSNLVYNSENSYPFIIFSGYPNEVLIGKNSSTHSDMISLLDVDVDNYENYFNLSDEVIEDIKIGKIKPLFTFSYLVHGRYWGPTEDGKGNIISVYTYNEKNLRQLGSQLIPVINELEKQGVNIDRKTLEFDDWKGKMPFRYPFSWLLNGTAEIFLSRAIGIIKKEDLYTIICNNGSVIKVDRGGNVIDDKNKNSLNEEGHLIYAPKVDEALTPSEIDLSSFEIKKELNPKFWKDNKLDSRIRIKLLDIADDFIDFLGVDWVKPEDITITGSLANFNWSKKYSDIDLHILLDYSKVDERTDFVNNYFYSQKKIWNEEHKDLKIFGFPVEIFVQDINKKHTSNGVYSLEKNEWIIEPKREKLIKKKINKKEIINNVSKYTQKIDILIDKVKKSKNDNYIIEKNYEDAQKLFNKLKKLRNNGLSNSNSEMNNGNIIFKALRRLGYINKLVKLINKGYNTLNSLP